MPDISLFNETQFLIRPNNRSKHLSTTFGQFNMTSGTFSNVKIVANGSSEQLMSNCAVMSAASKLLSNVFECPCIGCDYVIICPDFEVKPLTKVIDLIHTGSADVCRQELESIQGILDCLQIEQINDQILTLMSKEFLGVHDQNDQLSVVEHVESLTEHPGVPDEAEEVEELVDVESMIPPPNDVHIDRNETSKTVVKNKRVTFKNGVKPALKAIKADNTFMCSFCDKVFKFQFSLNLHLNRTHSQISKNKINWTPNVILSKDVKEPFKCDECDNIFVTHDKLLAHVALVHNGDHSTQTTQYKCHECDALFVTHKRLLTHVAKIHYSDRVMAFFGKNNRECVICNQVMSKRKFLFSHLANYHGIVDKFMPNGMKSRPPLSTVEKKKKLPFIDDEDKPIRQSTKSYNCQLCCTTRKGYKYLVNHYCTTHYKEEFSSIYKIDDSNSCPTCNLKYTRQDGLFFHLVTMHGAMREKIPKKEECQVIKQNNRTPKDDSKCFKCNICNRTRKSYKMILTHFAIFHFRKKLVKRFSIDGDNLKCTFCGIEMASVTNLILHLVYNHETLKNDIPSKESLIVPNSSEELVDSKKVPNINLYKCHICQITCSTYNNLLTHYGNVHYKQKLAPLYVPGEGVYSCLSCNKQFVNTYPLIRHLVTHHEALINFIPQKSSLLFDRNSQKLSKCNRKPNRKKQWYTCKFCQKSLLGRSRLIKHKRWCQIEVESRMEDDAEMATSEDQVTKSKAYNSTAETGTGTGAEIGIETGTEIGIETGTKTGTGLETGKETETEEMLLRIDNVVSTDEYFNMSESVLKTKHICYTV